MITLYHNPRCSKSRQALAILEEQGVTYKKVEYLKQGLESREVEAIIERLSVDMAQLIRTNEDAFLQQKFDLSDKEALVAAIVAHPILLQRPIAMNAEMAVIGRPPEAITTLL